MYSKTNIILSFFTLFLFISILYLYLERDVYGEKFIEEVRSSDRENILELIDDSELLIIGQSICVKIDSLQGLDDSSVFVTKEINNRLPASNFQAVKKNDDIITFLRYQSIIELCPSKIDKLSEMIEQASSND
tara:strand:- start:292 stop:690 length:399 start_codon:yes stop_codon:yes gene_type:complete